MESAAPEPAAGDAPAVAAPQVHLHQAASTVADSTRAPEAMAGAGSESLREA